MRIRRSDRPDALKFTVAQISRNFFIITTALVIINGAWTTLRASEWAFSGADLLRIPLFAFIALLPSVLNVFFECRSLKAVIQFQLVHFVLTAAFVFGAMMILGMPGRETFIRSMIAFFLIYAAYTVHSYVKNSRVAAQINKKLDALHQQDNATHPAENATHRD